MPDAPAPEPAEPTPTPAPAAPAPTPAPPVPGPPPAPAAPADDPAEPNENIDELPEWARNSLTKANKEAAGYRSEAQKARAAAEQAQKDFVQKVGKALGLVTDDEPPTVEGLTQALQDKDQTLSASQAETQALRIENAILRHADRFGGDVDALTDSESFKKKLKELDPTADDHAAQVEALVKSTVESHARYRKAQVAPKSSDGDPAPAGGAPAGEKSIDDIRKERQNRRGVES